MANTIISVEDEIKNYALEQLYGTAQANYDDLCAWKDLLGIKCGRSGFVRRFYPSRHNLFKYAESINAKILKQREEIVGSKKIKLICKEKNLKSFEDHLFNDQQEAATFVLEQYTNDETVLKHYRMVVVVTP